MEIKEVKKEATAQQEHKNFYSSWKTILTTTHHTDIGIMYLVFSLFFFFMGGFASLLVRYGLTRGGSISPEAYASLFTLHGLSMIFLFVIPAWAGFGNYLVPKYIGAKDMYFPKLNALGFWLLPPAAILIWGGMPNVGWTAYAPLSIYVEGWGMDMTILGLHLIGTSSIVGAINFIVTIMKMRAPNVSYRNMPLMVWTQLTTAFLQALATPVLAMALTLLLLDRNLGTGFFNPALGGDPIMFQHLFWFYSHPAVYIMILPGMGLISQILPSMSRQRIFGYSSIAVSTALIGFLGFGVWAHHMWTSGLSITARVPFMFMTMAIAIPSGVKIFNWVATLYGGKLKLSTPMLFSLSFILSFIIQGIEGVFLANIPLDYQLHDTYYVVSHLHYVLFGVSAQAVFAGIYYYFPYMTGRKYSEMLGQLHFALTTVGMYTLFTAMLFMGLAGAPRRYYQNLPEFFNLNVAASFGAILIAFSALVFLYNILSSWYQGPLVENQEDPWKLADYGMKEWPDQPDPPDQPDSPDQ